jgi:hypothetical protein
MISFLKKILKIKTKDNNTISLEKFNIIKQEYEELYQISQENVRLIKGSISILNMQLAAAGIRETRKKKPILNKLLIKLEEEQYYVKKYKSVVDVIQKGRVPKKIAIQY